MAKIIVNSDPSFDRGDVQDNRSHPGTNGDDIFIISPESHGYPMANDNENLSGGKDTFRLSTDIEAKNKTHHPYQEGGGIVFIQNFDIEDKIVLPKEVPMEELLMLGYGYIYPPHRKQYQFNFELVHDPHDLYWQMFGRRGNISTKFDMNLEEGKAKITGGTSRNTTWSDRSEPEPDPEYGDPRAMNAKLNQLHDPAGFEEYRSKNEKRILESDLYRSGDYLYAADRLAAIESTYSEEKPSLHEIMRRISTPSGTTFYEYAYGSTPKKEAAGGKPISTPNNYKIKAIDKITNFNPSTDTLDIDADSFGIDISATFAAGKNKRAVKKKLAKQDFDFLYDQKKGGLYFNENGSDKGFGDGGIIAILKGAPDLTINNLDFT